MRDQAMIETVAGGSSTIARLLAADMNIEELRTLDVLHYNEWELFDRTVYEVARNRLRAANDLISRNLTFPVTNAMGVPVLHWQTGSDVNPAEVDMDAQTFTQNDRQTFDNVYLPLPITHKNFQISPRVLAASRRNGMPLDTSMSALASRVVSEKIDDVIVNGASITHGGGTVYGYTNFPGRVTTVSLTADWSLTATTGATILGNVLAMIQAAKDLRYYGPYGLYIPATYESKMEEDFKTNVMGTIRERLQAIGGLEFVSALDQLATNNVVLVQLTSDVVQLVDGIRPTLVSWEEQGGKKLMFEVMAIMVPRLHVDANGGSGIVHATT